MYTHSCTIVLYLTYKDTDWAGGLKLTKTKIVCLHWLHTLSLRSANGSIQFLSIIEFWRRKKKTHTHTSPTPKWIAQFENGVDYSWFWLFLPFTSIRLCVWMDGACVCRLPHWHWQFHRANIHCRTHSQRTNTHSLQASRPVRQTDKWKNFKDDGAVCVVYKFIYWNIYATLQLAVNKIIASSRSFFFFVLSHFALRYIHIVHCSFESWFQCVVANQCVLLACPKLRTVLKPIKAHIKKFIRCKKLQLAF